MTAISNSISLNPYMDLIVQVRSRTHHTVLKYSRVFDAQVFLRVLHCSVHLHVLVVRTAGFYSVWLNLNKEGLFPGSNALLGFVVDEMARQVESKSEQELKASARLTIHSRSHTCWTEHSLALANRSRSHTLYSNTV